ncbi:MAG: LytTR family DNA-binding domain-containing protein [Anaerostipes sp.]|jgi:DNA-binding LytR/AlgR family response regulator|nr:LytTR family DNA-binding domain-containing protein [Anaerostipes sp.]MDD3746558.1 LytTR family DNA-binding domain-containing protein [Anaerostipes sp.]
MLWKIAICDDEIMYCDKILQLCKSRLSEEDFEVDFQTFQNGADLLAAKDRFNLIFLDIEMPGLDGFEVAKSLISSAKKQHRSVYIIYITSHDEWIQKAFEVRAYRYIYKKDIFQIPDIMIHALKELSESTGLVLKIRSDGIYSYFLQFSEIYALESLGDDTIVYFKDTELISSESITQLSPRLDNRFIEFNRGKIVNLQKIKAKTRYLLVLRNNKKFKVSKRKDQTITHAFQNYVLKNIDRR